MIKALNYLSNPKEHLDEPWLKYLYATKEKNYNIEHLNSIKDLTSKLVYKSVLKNMEVLNDISEKEKINEQALFYVEETLKWCEIAKVGSKKERKEWIQKGYDLRVHNIGSSQIYLDSVQDSNPIIYVLIKTHGLIGQYIRGEVNLNKNKELYDLINNGLIEKNVLEEVLIILNRCIIETISKGLYDKVKEEIYECVEAIINNKFLDDENNSKNIINRFKKLNTYISTDSIEELKKILENKKISERIIAIFNKLELWYYESSLFDFSITEQIKILLLVYNNIDDSIEHLTLENIMKTIYLDYKDKKVINIYKKRIIEKYLDNILFEDIINNNVKINPHINYFIKKQGKTVIFTFTFSKQATKLIEFCEVAYSSSSLYQKAVFLLYDLFGFRRDEYDRFYNEIGYLNTMNASLNHKAKILDYIMGSNILDVGPGGGALMDLILKKYPNKSVYGIDISQNVIDELSKKKTVEKRKWNVVKGDALDLNNYFNYGQIDTIIYSSIIHELFSYIETDHQKFNHKTIEKTLKSAYQILPKGGRIIIRDGIMTEPQNQYRIIEFFNPEDINILDRYCQDFKGRKVSYQCIGNNRVKMLINDAMEFLYTYTWGEDSYSLEVKEQFGYFTPTEYIDFVKQTLGKDCRIVECNAFLQTGYEENLLNKISFYDENIRVTRLPNSTCIIVIEKTKD